MRRNSVLPGTLLGMLCLSFMLVPSPGLEIHGTSISHQDIVEGGGLKFIMGDRNHHHFTR